MNEFEKKEDNLTNENEESNHEKDVQVEENQNKLPKNLRIGWCICASYCNHSETLKVMKRIKDENDVEIIPIVSENAAKYDTRFGTKEAFLEDVEKIAGNKVLKTPVEVEVIGPQNIVDIIVALPCTGNTLAKLALGITDNSVLGAIKTMRRENKPVILAVSSNDMASLNLKNLGNLMVVKDIYFVPLRMDNPVSKPNSMASDFNLLEETILKALEGKQLQPVLR